MLEPMAVAVHAMRRAMPDRAHTVAVCGLGTIGLLLAMFLREAGVGRVLAIGNKDLQRREAVGMGLPEDCFFDSRGGPASRWVMERTDGLGADVFFECVGRDETVAEAVQGTAPGGRVCLVGNPASAMRLEKDVYWKILRSQLTVTGTWNSAFGGFAAGGMAGEDDWGYVLERLSGGAVSPESLISHRLPLEGLMDGLRIMKEKSEEYGKIMCVF